MMTCKNLEHKEMILLPTYSEAAAVPAQVQEIGVNVEQTRRNL